jgi:hypothetical protein
LSTFQPPEKRLCRPSRVASLQRCDHFTLKILFREAARVDVMIWGCRHRRNVWFWHFPEEICDADEVRAQGKSRLNSDVRDYRI